MSSLIDNLANRTEDIDRMKDPLEVIPHETKQLKETHTAKKVELVKNLMKKYNKTNEDELLKEELSDLGLLCLQMHYNVSI